MYTDPDGNNPLAWIVPTVIQSIQNYQNAKERGLNNGQAFGYAATNFAVSGLSSMLNVPGMLPNAALHSGINVLGNGISNSLFGESFFSNWGAGAISGAVSGGFSGYMKAKTYGLNYLWGTSQTSSQNLYAQYVNYVAENDGDIDYNENTYRFKRTTLIGHPDEDIGSDPSASQTVRGAITIQKHHNGRWIAVARAETFPGESGGNKIGANLRVINNGKEVGFQYLSMANEWGANFYDDAWNQLGYARLYLPTTGNVRIQINVYTYQYRFWKGNTIDMLYSGYIDFP